jgi:hypothetical protein
MLHHTDRLLVKEGGKMDWGQYKLPTQSDAGGIPPGVCKEPVLQWREEPPSFHLFTAEELHIELLGFWFALACRSLFLIVPLNSRP